MGFVLGFIKECNGHLRNVGVASQVATVGTPTTLSTTTCQKTVSQALQTSKQDFERAGGPVTVTATPIEEYKKPNAVKIKISNLGDACVCDSNSDDSEILIKGNPEDIINLELAEEFILIHPNVTSLSLVGSTITKEAFAKIASSYSTLKSLVLSNCKFTAENELAKFATVDVGDRAMIQMIEKCKDLEEIIFSGCKQITYKTINTIANNCLKLKSIAFEGCPVSSDIIVKLIAKCPKLTSIKASIPLGRLPRTAEEALGHYYDATENEIERLNAVDWKTIFQFTVDKCRLIE